MRLVWMDSWWFYGWQESAGVVSAGKCAVLELRIL